MKEKREIFSTLFTFHNPTNVCPYIKKVYKYKLKIINKTFNFPYTIIKWNKEEKRINSIYKNQLSFIYFFVSSYKKKNEKKNPFNILLLYYFNWKIDILVFLNERIKIKFDLP